MIRGSGRRTEYISRRRFLTYMLGAAGAFMGTGMIAPMLRFAVDAMVRKGSGADQYIDTGMRVSEITDKPTKIQVRHPHREAWYYNEGASLAMFVLLYQGRILCLSPRCTHLGCQVNSDSATGGFLCPCHMGRYTASGINIRGTPPTRPLDEYPNKTVNGMLHVKPKSKERHEKAATPVG